MPICPWDYRTTFRFGDALDSVISTLAQQLEKGGNVLSPPTIYRFAKSSAHYLVGRWPGEKPRGSRALLPILLARVFTTCYETEPDTARAAAVTLAAAAFACDTCPGGEEPTLSLLARSRRASSVLRHYQTDRPDREDVAEPFLFGFFGVLPRCITNGLDAQLAPIALFLAEKKGDSSDFNPHYGHIWSMPQSFLLADHILACLFKCFSGPCAIDGELARVLADLWIVGADVWIPSQSIFTVADPRMYANAAIALCSVESKGHQELFMNVIATQTIPDSPLTLLGSNDNTDLLWQLCHTLVNIRTAMFPVAAVHFGLLVASVISSTKDSLDDRRSALRPLLSFHDKFPDLIWPSPFVFEELVSHLEQGITEGSTFSSLGRTMQFVVDFCCDDWSPNMGSGGTDGVDWRGKLQELKDRYRPEIDEIRLGIDEIGYPSIEALPAEMTAATPDASPGPAGIREDWYYPSDPEWCC
ncbi:hypothetical protein FS749_009336 [Ceratobasidium sp. UAMH 11750]|nr:hypothetical protein FS749_009336 [Ceratobasidium sp. UAMH 11750]